MSAGSTEQRKLATIVFTDMVGSTQLKQDLGDREAITVIQRHHAVVREILGQFKEGEEISTAGDSFFLIFGNPSDAVKFALLLQAGLRTLVKETGRPVFDRVGIHVGEVFLEERAGADKPKDLHGIQVDTCSRLMGLAKANQILMTRLVFDNARQVLRGQDMQGVGLLSWLNHGPYLLKGVEEPLEICEVGEASVGPLTPPTSSEKGRRHVSDESEPVLGWRPALEQIVPNTQWVLERKLGEGGFGEVWLGRHQTMKERRVFKFCFRADRVRSLKREMTLFRLLKERIGDHPNIVALRDVYFDEPPFYVVMDYVDGRDLKSWSEERLPAVGSAQAGGGVGSVPLEVRLELVAQVADALQAAHDAGVIHRDVKPGNILISDFSETNLKSKIQNLKLVAKLTDFGIGQVVSEEALKGMTKAGFTQTMISDSSSSHTGSQMYMAPELLAGKPASTRSDIYSLGVVLYQLLVGDLTRPLTTDWAGNISDPVLRDDLKHCFAGDPQERFADAGQLANSLRSLDKRRAALAVREKAAFRRRLVRRTTVTFAIVAAVFLLALFAFKQGGASGKEGPPVRLAVLPLVNLAGDVAQDYFADEMTDDLISKLGQISGLRVIGRATVMQFKQTTNSVPGIARQLSVDAVVQGTVKRELDKLQIAVRLFKGATDRPLWSTNCERDLRDLFALQNEVALGIASKMKLKLRPEEQTRLANAPLVNPEALDLYYRGKGIRTGSPDANNKEAIKRLERAVEIDKDFAPAWAALAGAYIARFYNFEPENYKELEGKAQTAILKALQLDPNLAAAYVQHGRLYWNPGNNFQHEAALGLFYRALQLNSSSVGALTQISSVYHHTGFFDEAIAKAKEATALNPLETYALSRACSHLWKGEYEQSLLLWPRVTRGTMPAFCGSHWALALFALGRTNEANAKLQEYLTLNLDDRPGELTAMNAVLLAAAGDEAGAIAQVKIAEKKTQSSFGETHHATYLIACAYARLNKTPEALQWLKKTADTGFPCYPLFRDDPNLKSLRTDAGFMAFLQKQETAWKKRKADWAKFEDSGKATAIK